MGELLYRAVFERLLGLRQQQAENDMGDKTTKIANNAPISLYILPCAIRFKQPKNLLNFNFFEARVENTFKTFCG